jgi:hypothetical protein
VNPLMWLKRLVCPGIFKAGYLAGAYAKERELREWQLAVERELLAAKRRK